MRHKRLGSSNDIRPMPCRYRSKDPSRFRAEYLCAWLVGFFLVGHVVHAATPDAPQKTTNYVVVVTGGELLSGVYADGHTLFLTRTLQPLGLRCVGSLTVDDRPDDMKQALRLATEKAPLVIVTGGLGPTDNDITRQTISDFLAIPLQEGAEVLERMSRRFGVSGDQLRVNLRRQTLVPKLGTYLENPHGSAVGLVFDDNRRVVVALPGPPRELQPMVRDQLVPYLSHRFGTRLPGCSLTMRFVGIGQSGIDETLQQHVPLPSDVTLASQFEGSRVDFTFSLPDDTPGNRVRLSELKKAIFQHLGDYVYADDGSSLEQHVLRLLQDRGQTVSLAEVGSGGGLAARLSGAAEVSGVLAGALVAPSQAKLRRLLPVPNQRWQGNTSSAQRTELFAAAVSELTGSQWAIAVGELQTGDDGKRSAEVVFRMANGDLQHQRIQIDGTGDIANARLSTEVFDRLRRMLR